MHRPEFEEAYQKSRDYDNLRTMMFSIPLVLRARCIVETGLSRGLSTRIFLEACKLLEAHLYTYDIEDSPATREALKDYNDYWTFEVKDSIEAANQFGGLQLIDVLFLDSDHAYNHVIRELYVWKEHLAPHGVILVDDTRLPGPLRAVEEFQTRNSSFLEQWGLIVFDEAEGMALLYR